MIMNFWDNLFKDGAIWGNQPSDSAIWTSNYFKSFGIKNVLIPGFGYGRNAIPFINNGIDVTGIEISNEAIITAKNNGVNSKIYLGSVLDMPFSESLYNGIYSYSLFHLFNFEKRSRIMKSLYNQLSPDGLMVTVTISTKSSLYGEGTKIGHNRFVHENGNKVYFSDEQSIKQEFMNYGLIEYSLISEPIKFMSNQSPIICYQVICRKSY